jgi:hypothetical protein
MGGERLKTFRRLKNVRKSYAEQGAIFFACATCRQQPRAVQAKIDRLCQSVGGEYAPALKAFLTTDADWLWVCDHYHISGATLERLRRKFYEAW